jgi:YegS/Rv2252/BmrU family lipid kinase
LPEQQTWFVIINPVAGRGSVRYLLNDITSLMQSTCIQCKYIQTNKQMHAASLAREAVQAGYRKFIAVGGDGTANEVVNGLMSQNNIKPDLLTLATVPVGTGNDWARSLGMPKRLCDVIKLIINNRTILYDLGKANYKSGDHIGERYFLNMAGLGIDSHVLKLLKDSKAGPWAYYLGLLKGIKSYESPTLKISASGYNKIDKVLVVFIGSGSHCGGGMKIAPHALPNDGFIYVTVVKEMSKWRILQHLPRLFNGNLHDSPYVQGLKVTDIKIDTELPIEMEADGELLGYAPIHISVMPRSLRVIANL